MQYIKKQPQEPQCLADYKRDCTDKGETPSYTDFGKGEALRYKNILKDVLLAEQHYVCCYCQQKIDSHTSSIEHLYPRKGSNKQLGKQKELDYYNLFASCTYSKGQKKKKQHCDEHKMNHIIRCFLHEENCECYFYYALSGEILPNERRYGQWSEYLAANNNGQAILTQDELEAVQAIKVLNLNHHRLVEKRKECIDILLKVAPRQSQETRKALVERWLKATYAPDFLSLRQQYIDYLNSKLSTS